MKPTAQEANSLETVLISAGKNLKANKEKYLQTVLLILVVIAALIFFRTYFYGKPLRFQQDFSQAHLLSTQQAMISGTPDAKPYEALAARYTKGNEGAEVRIGAGEALLKTGQSEVDQKKTAGKAGKASAAVKEMNPESTFNSAMDQFTLAAGMASDKLLASRALFGSASVCENLAAVTAGADQVNVKLDTAVKNYQQILDKYPDTPFAAVAKERLAVLAEPVVREFYIKTADAYVTMPEPELEAEPESILSEEGDKLDPDAAVSGEDFSLQGEESATPETENTEVAAPEAENTETAAPEAENAEAVVPEAENTEADVPKTE